MAVCGSPLSSLALSASLTWAFLPALLKWQKLSSKHLGVCRLSSYAAKKRIGCETSGRLELHQVFLPHSQISPLGGF